MTIEERARKAVELKQSGSHNCCQAVTAVLADQAELSEGQLKSVSAGFCQGAQGPHGRKAALPLRGVRA